MFKNFTELFTSLFLLTLIVFTFTSFQACSEKQQKPNIIFIMSDDLGYGHLGCYGQEIIKTPNIDQLAEEGLRFTQAYSGCSVCAPSRNSLMTGQHSGHISVRGNGGGVSLLKSDITIAQILKKAGYITGLFGKWGLGEEYTVGIPNKKGFDQFFGYLHQLHAQFYYPEFLWQNQEKVYFPENRDMKRGTYSPDLIMNKSFEFIRSSQDKPFFLYLPMAIPHHEFIAPDETLALYSGKFEEFPIPHWRDGYALPEEPRATFAAMVTHMDKHVGELMSFLREIKIDEKTIIFFVSDNGAAHGPLENTEFFNANGPLREFKGSLYEGGIRVPMIVRWPGKIKPNTTTALITYFPDILPTLAELADVQSLIPDNTDGLSILPTLLNQGNQKKHPFLYWEDTEYNRTPPFGPRLETAITAVRMGNWKGVRKTPDSPVELYNLDIDISERQDLSGSNPGIVKKINEIMKNEHFEAPPQVDMTHEEAAKLYIPGRR